MRRGHATSIVNAQMAKLIVAKNSDKMWAGPNGSHSVRLSMPLYNACWSIGGVFSWNNNYSSALKGSRLIDCVQSSIDAV